MIKIIFIEILLQDKYCLQSLQIHWNSEWFGGFSELLTGKEINYTDTDDFNTILRLSHVDLMQIQSTSMEYCIDKCLKMVQNATKHQDVVDSLIKLTGYINLYKCIKYNFIFENNILSLPWKESFDRFLNVIPSSQEDNELLQYLLEFLTNFAALYKEEGIECWISNFLKNETNPILTLLSNETIEDAESKILNKDLLQLITTCVTFEQHYLDLYGLNLICASSWTHLIEIIATNLKFNDSQHFYNLAYLDALLSCLVHLTASLGWVKNNKNDLSSRNLLVQLVTGLCEMIGAFHCGKGDSAVNSVMGLSITRHAVLILNHLLAEMQQSNINEWECCFIDEESGIEDNFYNLTSLWFCRDIVLRAGIFQLFAGLATSHKCAINIVQEYRRIRKADVWEIAINVLLDHEEANIIRENVAVFLTNLSSHIITISQESFTLDKAVTPYSQVLIVHVTYFYRVPNFTIFL
ncbi:rotatin [Holotrichia oblita]|uniref:Rotatin n=1 Tax=Holotrichia oblita TaxID=644536 RepID=A0ACB9T1N2_HOLOL|nr:rotatin [Holotrichia oblita]